jgi:NADPH-dependent F420 reductase
VKIAIIGGTGKLGRALGLRWARAGHEIVLGSRDPVRAKAVADALASSGRVSAGDYGSAAASSEVVVLAIPWSAHRETASAISVACVGKVVVDTTVPLNATRTGHALERGSAAELLQRELLPSARVVAGLHTIAAGVLADASLTIESDVLLCGDDEEAKKLALKLAEDLPARAFDVGPLSAAAVLERLPPLLIGLNKRYRRKHIGIRLSEV